MTLRHARAALRGAADPRRARFLRSYFKTGPGQYGEGDVFVGVTALALEIVIRQQAQANGARRAALLDRLAASERMWDRRMAVLSTLYLVKRGR